MRIIGPDTMLLLPEYSALAVALIAAKGNVLEASRKLGVPRSQLRYSLEQYGRAALMRDALGHKEPKSVSTDWLK